MLVETLNPAQSINQSINQSLCDRLAVVFESFCIEVCVLWNVCHCAVSSLRSWVKFTAAMTFGSPRMATGFQYSPSLRRTRRLTPVKTPSFTQSLVGVCIHLHSLTVTCGTPRRRAKLAFTVNCLSQLVCCIL